MAMISLKKNVDELERREGLFQAALNCYLSAINSIQSHTIELGAELVEEYRRRLRSLRRNVQNLPSAEVLETSRVALDKELAWFQKAATGLLEEKEKELQDIIFLLTEAARTLGARDARHASKLQEFTSELETVSRLDDLSEVRRRLAEQVIELKTCMGAFQRESDSSVSQLQQELKSIQERLDQAEQLATTDPLTGLLNRREGERRLHEMVRAGNPFCVLVFDLDRFKTINDRYGHVCGDQVLKSFARRLADAVRPNDPVCRWGGDEFLVIMACPLRDAMHRASQIGEKLSGRYTIIPGGRETTVLVSASLGVAEYVPGESAEQLFERADGVLYRQKATGTLP